MRAFKLLSEQTGAGALGVEAAIIMVPETDEEVNPLGVKGIGEIGNMGMNATGKRIRALPIMMDRLRP